MTAKKTKQTKAEKAVAAAQSTPGQSNTSRGGLNFGSCTAVGHVREHNEDNLVVAPPLFAVADGMGGHEAGEVASEITVNTLAELAPEHPDADLLARAVTAANLNVIKAPKQGIGRVGMGTTLTAAMLEGEDLIIAQVGDSRAYLLHNGGLQRLTRDHSLMADMIEAGQLTEEEARVHPNRSVITRAIGSDPYMKPDLYELKVESGDRLLLCSDGITTMLEDSTVRHIMNVPSSAQNCADALVQAALDAGGFDNATAVVIDVEGFQAARERKAAIKSRIFGVVLVLLLIGICALAAFGGYQYLNQSAYLIEEDGYVAIYRGLNDELFGMPLSSLEELTTVEVDSLQPGVANRIKEGMAVGGVEEAYELIESYEEEIARSQASDTPTTTESDSSSSDENSDSDAEAGE